MGEGARQDLGFITNGDGISLKELKLEGCAKATFRVASAGAGWRIEQHADSASGTLLGAATGAATGGWQK